MKQGITPPAAASELFEAPLGGFQCPHASVLESPAVFALLCHPASQTSHHSLLCPVSILPDPSPAIKVRSKEKDQFHLCSWSGGLSQHGSEIPSKKERID